MSQMSDHYLEQAERCQAEADVESLPQVRARALRSAANWRSMAQQVLRAEKARERIIRQ